MEIQHPKCQQPTHTIKSRDYNRPKFNKLWINFHCRPLFISRITTKGGNTAIRSQVALLIILRHSNFIKQTIMWKSFVYHRSKQLIQTDWHSPNVRWLILVLPIVSGSSSISSRISSLMRRGRFIFRWAHEI